MFPPGPIRGKDAIAQERVEGVPSLFTKLKLLKLYRKDSLNIFRLNGMYFVGK
jgi:hypothetical protein